MGSRQETAQRLMCARFGCGHAWWVVVRRPLPMYPNVALASVVPCQAGVSVLLQPHGPDVAYVLPAVQKIAQMGAERGEKRQREWGRGCEVLYDGGKCTSLPFLADLLFLQMRLLSHWMIWLNSGCFFLFFHPPTFGCQWCDLHMHFSGCGTCTNLPAAARLSRTLLCFDIEAQLPEMFSEILWASCSSQQAAPVTRLIAFVCD